MYRSFIEVYKTKSLLKAAKRLEVSRSAVGQNVKALNNQIGVTLFETTPKGIKTTEAADLLYKEIEPMFSRLTQLEKNLIAFNENSEGLVKIGCAELSLTVKLAEYMKSFRIMYPRIKFEIICLDGYIAIEKLKMKEVDLLVGFIRIDSDAELVKFPIGETQSLFIAEKNFARTYNIGSIITREKFNELPLIGVRKLIPWKEPVIYADRFETMFQYVMRGMGIAWIFDDFINGNHPHDPYVRFQVEGIGTEKNKFVCIYCPKFISNTALKFVRHIENNHK